MGTTCACPFDHLAQGAVRMQAADTSRRRLSALAQAALPGPLAAASAPVIAEVAVVAAVEGGGERQRDCSPGLTRARWGRYAGVQCRETLGR